MSNNNDEKAARARRNLQKKAQDLAKNRDKYLTQNQKKSEKSSEKKANSANTGKNNNNRGHNNQNRGANNKNDSRKVNLPTTTRRGAVVRAQRMVSSDINMRATQHIVNIPVNKSIYNGFGGEQLTPSTIKKLRASDDSVKIIPLGGLGEFGIGK
ncbi:MAG: hypothetical protein KIG14_00120, partial [Candidatus Sacchiramonaceae bacterium]|nr:hypothetical protein [Candidatus Saccharimonadaceae bacterium]